MEHQVVLGIQVHLESQDILADKAGQDPKDPLDHEDQLEKKEIRVLERWEMLDLQEHQAFQVPQAMERWDPQVLLASRVFLESQALLGRLVQREMMDDVILETV